MRSDRTVLQIGPTRLEARVERGDVALWTGVMEYRSSSELVDSIARLAAETEVIKPGHRLLVELERPLVQLRTLEDIPPVRRRLIRQVVEQQAHRYFRKNGVPLVLDATRSPGVRSRIVHAAAAEEPVITAIVDGALAGGFRLEDVRPVEWSSRGLSLLLADERERRSQTRRKTRRRAVAVVVALWLSVVAIGVGSHRIQLRAVNRELETVAQPAIAIGEARRLLTLTRETVATLDREQHRRTRMVALISAVAQVLPDSAFITGLTMDQAGEGRISGYATRASEVLARLDASRAVVGPTLESQQGKQVVAGRELESFSIRFGTEGPDLPAGFRP